MGKNAESQALRERNGKIQKEWIHQSRYMQIKREVVEVEGHPTTTWELIVHPGAAAVIPIDQKGDLVLVEQWRRAIEKITLELPAGLLDPGENPLDCAQRELQEEAGYKAKTLIPFGGCYSAPGISNEYVYLFIGKQLQKSQLVAEDTHAIDVRHVSLDDAIKLIENGTIIDAKTIVGILRYYNQKL